MKKGIIILIIVIIFFCLGGYYLYYENNYLKVSNYIVVNDKIPSDFNNYKIVQVSDFHNTKSKKLTNDLVLKIKNINPDIIVLTGDLIDAKKTNVDIAISFIKEIKSIAPIYFVTGNHEASTKKYDELKEKLTSNNVVILDNKNEIIKVNNSEINLLGIDDPQFENNTYRDDMTIVLDEVKQIEYDDKKFSILLSHRPELFNTYVDRKFDLVLTGHAHGGQIRIPFIGGLIAPNQGIFPKYTSGEFNENETTMIISRGIGNSILPFRINNRPELVTITLKNN